MSKYRSAVSSDSRSLESEKFLEGKVQPHARRRSAEQIIVAGEDAPDFPRILQFRLPNLKILQRDSLAVEHSKNVVVGLHEKLRRIRERLVPGKPCRLRMPVRTNDGQGSHLLVERPGYFSCTGLGRKQTIWMDQHDSDTTLSLRIGERAMRERYCGLTSIHVVNYFLISISLSGC